MNRDVAPIPDHGVGDIAALEQARREATTALLAAEQAEKAARTARKQANWKIKIYERMLQEYNGQLKLPDL